MHVRYKAVEIAMLRRDSIAAPLHRFDVLVYLIRRSRMLLL